MTDPATAVSAAPLVAFVQPYISAVVTALIGGAVTYGGYVFHKLTGSVLDDSAETAIRKWASSEAGALVAEAADNLSSRSIPVGSAMIAAAVTRLEAVLPDEVKWLGFTPDHLATIVAGEIGKLQAQATAVPVSPSTTSPTPALSGAGATG
jgi:hypothetical protein